MIQTQAKIPGAKGLDLSSLPPATLAAAVQSQGGAFNGAGVDILSLPAASLAALIQSQRNLPPGVKSTLPRELLNAAARMSPEEFEKALGIYPLKQQQQLQE